MPLTHIRNFRVRHYECDAYGHLNKVNYLRFMQETAFDASANAGYGQENYEAMGRFWLIRETEIEYLRPVQYNDVVEVKTWVVDFRRARSRRAYEFRLGGSGVMVAKASTDWVFLDMARARPVSIPKEIVSAFFPEGLPETSEPRKRFPRAPKPPPGVFELQRRVKWRDLDTRQHVNNANYLAYIEDCGTQAGIAFGWSVNRMQKRGFGIFARRHHIEYRQSAALGDELQLMTWISNIKNVTVTRHYTITRMRDQELLARAYSQFGWVDLDTGKLIRIPPDLLEDFESNTTESEG